MAGGVHNVRLPRRGSIEGLLQLRPCGAERARDVGEVERVARGVEMAADPGGPRIVGGEVAEELDEHPEVVRELTELALLLPRVVNCNVAVREWKDDVIFLRKIVEGATDKSYGIHVARLAGIPPEVVGRARVILANLEEEELDLRGKPKLAQSEGSKSGASAHVQLAFFGPQPDPVREEIEHLDVDNMTPMDALLKLKELHGKLTDES